MPDKTTKILKEIQTTLQSLDKQLSKLVDEKIEKEKVQELHELKRLTISENADAPNANQPWTPEDELLLQRAWIKFIGNLANRMGRTYWGICGKYMSLRKITGWNPYRGD